MTPLAERKRLAKLEIEARKLRKEIRQASPRKVHQERVQPIAKGQRQVRERNRERLGWIKRAPCIACLILGEQQTSATEAAHYKGEVRPKGWRWFGPGEKSHDRMTTPLCGVAHHRDGPNAEHQMHERNFWPWLGVDPVDLILDLDAAFDAGRDAETVVRQYAIRTLSAKLRARKSA